MNKTEDLRFGTRAIHAGIEPDIATGAIMTPIYQSSTFVQEEVGKHKGFEYGRTQNPTRIALENNIAALEKGKYGLCFSSGMAATDTIIRLCNPGDEIIVTNDLYGGTYRLFKQVYENYGLKFHFVDMRDTKNIEAVINKKTKMVWVETPTNPALSIIDINQTADISKQHNLILCVDNTFATPYLQLPLELGADIVMHSGTKYLGGHSDVIHGAVVVNDPEIAEKLYFLQNSAGAIPGPQDCFLMLRGIKTLHLRMQRHCENADLIASYLIGHNKIDQVYYPGIASHQGHKIAKQQMRAFGGMVSFSIKDADLQKTMDIIKNVSVFSLAESLGGVESLIGHPATMTHAAIPREERIKSGVSDSLVRLSVGIEDVQDLIEDLENMLK